MLLPFHLNSNCKQKPENIDLSKAVDVYNCFVMYVRKATVRVLFTVLAKKKKWKTESVNQVLICYQNTRFLRQNPRLNLLKQVEIMKQRALTRE